jgi:hypothetical protein
VKLNVLGPENRFIMEAFIIEQAGEIKEAFSYDRPLIEASRHALEEYARTTYGDDAIIRPMTRKETADFARFGSEYFGKDLRNDKRRDR